MIREPVVAGRFYEADAVMLRRQIDSCFRHRLGASASPAPAGGRLVGFIAPHAGFMFSGPVATHAFERLSREKTPPDTIIIFGPKHTHYGESFSVSAVSAWKTPLGKVEIDTELRDKVLAGVELLRPDNEAHAFEHSIEVQLPFLQYFLPKLPRILPIALNYAPLATISQIAEGIARVVAAEKGKNIIFLASSDFSHDTPREEAYLLDRQVIDRILELDAAGVYNMIVEEDRSVCGVMPITALLKILAGCEVSAGLLKYATSMDVMRHDRGVGYGAIIFEEKA